MNAATEGQRLDKFLTRQAWAPTRSQLKQAIDRGDILVNEEEVKAGYSLREGDVIDVSWEPPPPPDISPENIPLDVIYEDEQVLVVNKQSGLVVHPAPGHPSGTLVNAVLYHVGTHMEDVGAELRPGIVHRLDKDTTGVMVVAKTIDALGTLGDQFAAHSTGRQYWALCHGPGLADEGTFDTFHTRSKRDRKRFTSKAERGRRAVTHFTVQERFDNGAVLVQCELETGRTHQVRVHLADHGAPILGDPVYGGRAAGGSSLIERTALHARMLAFDHPDTGERMEFEAALPEDFGAALEALRAGKSWR